MKTITVRAAGVKEPKFWTCNEHAELLRHVDYEEAVQEWVEDLWPEELPETLVVYGFAPIDLSGVDVDAERVLEHLLESMDEEYGDPDGSYTIATESMKAAAEVFVETIYAEYDTWACVKVCEKTVRVADIITAEIPIREAPEVVATVEEPK